MKKVLSILFVGAFVFASYANNGKGEAAKIVNYKEVISQLEYPKVCREKGIEGTVIVSLNIDVNGSVSGYEFLQSPCSDLQEVVENSLKDLTFTPATDKNGDAITGNITMPVNFKLTI